MTIIGRGFLEIICLFIYDMHEYKILDCFSIENFVVGKRWAIVSANHFQKRLPIIVSIILHWHMQVENSVFCIVYKSCKTLTISKNQLLQGWTLLLFSSQSCWTPFWVLWNSKSKHFEIMILKQMQRCYFKNYKKF